ncbi:UDP-N-acetylglucosamine transferase subunit ALG13 [Amphibalanus amphitrite]|uniref:UDP-N-acetylglucosamine transferase subunit ALG13 n=1 Tax=Amphibalanus amphitrite TaxID=1232801 RepID=A0A6A4WQA7_AMPAM|nr:UDP-N-acetylglucosamine transferase subunit ALG13 [Amphibalanus amphitrite]KAF0311650.1 UDP-N-acetylglucosamine transferase subunit ALG13 [Amphibalanus amphitrite]
MARVFVTVGTTEFDKLVRTVTSTDVLRTLSSRGYREMVLQIGAGKTEPPTGTVEGVAVRWFRSKPSIAEDMAAADLVIGHAGAGTCLEALRAGRALVVVTNTTLMDNHQAELAGRLAADGHLLHCVCETLRDTLAEMDLSQLRPLPPADPTPFAEHLERRLGLR